MSGANLFLTFCQWMVILILNQNGDLSTVGEYGFVTGMIAPIYVASTLNFRNLVSTDSRNQYTMSEYTTVRIITLAIAFIVVCIQGICSEQSYSVLSVWFASHGRYFQSFHFWYL
jgi:hypothetical protein